MTEDALVRIGISGLDEICLGGIPRRNVILVKGDVGTGKTTFGIEFIYRGITKFNEPGIIVVFETSPGKLVKDAESMGWDLLELQEQKKLQIVFTRPKVFEQELFSSDSLLLQMAAEIGARRISWVKNHLQIVASLLNMESNRLDETKDSYAITVLQSSGQRIAVMAQIRYVVQ
jgi:circadian clock protein KaiC